MADANESNDSQDNAESMSEDDKKKLEEEKEKLTKEIDKLEKYIGHAESLLESLKNGNIGDINDEETSPNGTDGQLSPSSIVSSSEKESYSSYEMYQLAGLYCTKTTDNEFVFNISSLSNKEAPAAVQFFTEGEKIVLGKWMMPLGISINYILDETPLENLAHVIPFLRNCKRHVLCYTQRKEQVDKLKEALLNVKNCKVDTNYGHLKIFIDFTQVKINYLPEKVNLTVHLFYNSGKVRPHSIKVDWSMEKRPSDEIEGLLDKYLKPFKKETLVDAYKKIAEGEYDKIDWEPEIYVEISLERISQPLESMSISGSESESDYEYASKKPKRVAKKQPAKSRKKSKNETEKIQTSVEKSTEDNNNNSNNFDLSENESPTNKRSTEKKKLVSKATKNKPPRKTIKHQGKKKVNAANNKLQSEVILEEPVLRATNTNNQVNDKTGLPKSRLNANGSLEPKIGISKINQKSTKTQGNKLPAKNASIKLKNKTPKVSKARGKKGPAKSPQKPINKPALNTRAKQAELNFKNNTSASKSTDSKEDSKSALLKQVTSTPVNVRITRLKQMSLNFSPIISNLTKNIEPKISTRQNPAK